MSENLLIGNNGTTVLKSDFSPLFTMGFAFLMGLNNKNCYENQ